MLADIEQVGWSVMKVANDMGPDFAYSLGMFRTFGHPEILMFGLSLQNMHLIINDVGNHVKAGTRYAAGQVTDEFLEGYDVTFRAVPKYQYRGHLGWATWLYDGSDFPALQLVFPDRGRRWPWEHGVTDGFRRQQPILADIDVPPWAKTDS